MVPGIRSCPHWIRLVNALHYIVPTTPHEDSNPTTPASSRMHVPCSHETSSTFLRTLRLITAPLHQHRHPPDPAHKYSLGNAPSLSSIVPDTVHKLHCVRAHISARLHCKRRKPDCRRTLLILPGQHPHAGMFSPRCRGRATPCSAKQTQR